MVPNYFAGIGDTPERSGVIGHAVKDVKRHAMFILNWKCFDRPGKKLLQIALADIAREITDVTLGRQFAKVTRVDLSGSHDPKLDDLELTPQRAAGVEKT